MTGSTRLVRLIVALTATVAIGVAGSLAVATTAGAKAKAKAPKGGIETPSAGTVTETGSSLMYPLFNLWAGGYNAKFPSVTVSTASTGSGTGLADAANGTVEIGASDAYLAPSSLTTTPTLLNIPLAISSQLIAYNIPGVTAHLVLSGKVRRLDLRGHDHKLERPGDRRSQPFSDVTGHPDRDLAPFGRQW